MDPILSDMTPFRIIGNLYFVGTLKTSSHLIATSEGLILIDSGYAETADVIVDSMTRLGFDIRDVKYLLLSHGHGDHTGGAKRLAELSGAKILMSEVDMRYLRKETAFVPDRFFKDGDVITLGETSILCLHTPGHSEGAMSFFFTVTENGQTYRAAMFGGASPNQLKKSFMNYWGVNFLMRGAFYRSIERLRDMEVDVVVGNHTWHNHTDEKYEWMLADPTVNPFIDKTEWRAFLDDAEEKMNAIIREESRTRFVTYAHRGASEYCPENTLLSFYTGIYMRANGIETDVQRTKDGVLVLFHDNTLTRVTGQEGAVGDYTLAQLQEFDVSKNGITDKIVTLEDFLSHFAFRKITFAIELKAEGCEKDVADMIRRYGLERRTVVTSFNFDYIKALKEYAPELRIGYLKSRITDEDLEALKAIGCDEICPKGCEITPERVAAWHREGFNVRAWGIADETVMRAVYDAGADGMTVNFPDKLSAYIAEKEAAGAEGNG